MRRLRNPFRKRVPETLREAQERLAKKLGYVPLVFGTSDEGGSTERHYWDVKAQEWKDIERA